MDRVKLWAKLIFLLALIQIHAFYVDKNNLLSNLSDEKIYVNHIVSIYLTPFAIAFALAAALINFIAGRFK